MQAVYFTHTPCIDDAHFFLSFFILLYITLLAHCKAVLVYLSLNLVTVLLLKGLSLTEKKPVELINN